MMAILIAILIIIFGLLLGMYIQYAFLAVTYFPGLALWLPNFILSRM